MNTKKAGGKPAKKPINISLAEPLKETAEAIISAQKSGSITALIEEALREKFSRMGLPTDLSPEKVLEELTRLRKEKKIQKK